MDRYNYVDPDYDYTNDEQKEVENLTLPKTIVIEHQHIFILFASFLVELKSRRSKLLKVKWQLKRFVVDDRESFEVRSKVRLQSEPTTTAI